MGKRPQKAAIHSNFLEELREYHETFRQLYTQYKKEQKQNGEAEKPIALTQEKLQKLQELQGQLNTLWHTLGAHVKPRQQMYKAPEEYHLILASALILLEDIRDATSHAVFRPVEEQQVQANAPEGPLDLIGQPSLCIWLEDLYRNAVNDLDYTKPAYLWQQEKNYRKADKKQDEQHWKLGNTTGLPFFLALFLTKSHTAWLCDQLLETSQKTRSNKRLLSYYSRRDGVSLLAVAEQDKGSLLVREIFGYLSLPPIDSAEGQKLDQQIKARRAEQKRLNQPDKVNDDFTATDVPPFRRKRKTSHYIMQVLDRLKLMPELQLRGFWEYNQGTAEEPDWQPKMEEVVAVQHPEKKKLVCTETYGRNNAQQIQAQGGAEKARFVYNIKNNNIRFVLQDRHNSKAVMPWRNFINWVYVVVKQEQVEQGKEVHEKIRKVVTNAVKKRHFLLQSISPLTAEQREKKQQQLRYLPKQFRQSRRSWNSIAWQGMSITCSKSQ